MPEVEAVVRALRPEVCGRTIRSVEVRAPRLVRGRAPEDFVRQTLGRRIESLERRGKFLVFGLRGTAGGSSRLLGHLGMTGRLYLEDGGGVPELGRSAGLAFELDDGWLIFEDVRRFGHWRTEQDGDSQRSILAELGPEPLDPSFGAQELAKALWGGRQSIKARLLDQATVAGVGNIYACEALFWARIHPSRSAGGLAKEEVEALWRALRKVLRSAIQRSEQILKRTPRREFLRRELFYRSSEGPMGEDSKNGFAVYDREGLPCVRCGSPISRFVQNGRSSYFCAVCQRDEGK